MNEQKMNYEHVLSPIKIGPMTLKNRVSFTPVWPSFATADGHVNRELIEWVRDIVKGGAACINIGCGCVNRNLPPFVTHLLRMSEESVVNEMTILSDLVHMYQCKIGIELFAINMYGGNFADRDHNGDKPAVELDPTYMTKEQIKEYIEDFALAAERAVRCGVDSLVIHGAHGQLPGCFLNKRINERTDEYGGSMENRCRIVIEIVKKIRTKVPKTYPVTVRMHFFDDEGFENDLQIPDYIEIAKYFEANGIDAIHFSIGTEDRTGAPDMKAGWRNEYYKAFKKELHIPIYGPNEVKTPEEAEAILEDGVYDFVIMGRPHSADPEWGNKAKSGHPEDIRPCLNCNFCVYHVTADQYQIRCTVNPTLGREIDDLIPAKPGEGTVAVIGGGPGGIQAAMTLADRGFHVVLFEEREELGGSLNLANKAPGKFRMDNLIRYYRTQVEKRPNIEVRLNQKITADNVSEIEKLQPYAVVYAAGGNPIRPGRIPGIEKGIPCNDVLRHEVKFENSTVAVIGGGMSGLETAEVLAADGNKVIIVEMAPIVGNGVYFYNVRKTRRILENAGCEIKTETALQEIKDGAVVVAPHKDNFISEAMSGIANIAGVADKVQEDSHEGPYEIPVNATVLALGVMSNTSLLETLEAKFDKVVAVGDCSKPGKIADATSAAYWRCKNL